MKLCKNVYLIGFMGAGKTTVSRKLARLSRTGSLDLDFYIERKTGMKIAKIFEESGEEGFRKVESECLLEVSSMQSFHFISCGGGIVEKHQNIDIMKNNGVIVYLECDVQNSALRIKNDGSRPLFSDANKAFLLLEKRRPLYEEACDFTVDTCSHTSSSVARYIFSKLNNDCVIN